MSDSTDADTYLAFNYLFRVVFEAFESRSRSMKKFFGALRTISNPCKYRSNNGYVRKFCVVERTQQRLKVGTLCKSGQGKRNIRYSCRRVASGKQWR